MTPSAARETAFGLLNSTRHRDTAVDLEIDSPQDVHYNPLRDFKDVFIPIHGEMMKANAIGVMVLGALALTGCTATMQQINKDLAALNQRTAAGVQPSGLAASTPQTTQVALVVPKDGQLEAAVEAALPNIKKILSIHQCVNVDGGMRHLHAYAMPGVRMTHSYEWNYPNSRKYMDYHDRNKCVGVRAIDNFAMPALNALHFRVVYYAEDSGETVNFGYRLRRADDGSWLLASTPERI